MGYFDINLSGDWLDNWIWTDESGNVRYEGRYTNENRQLSLSFDNFGETGRSCGFAGIWKQYNEERGELVIEVLSDGNKQQVDLVSTDGYDDTVNDDKNDNNNNDLPWGILSESQEDTNVFEDTLASAEIRKNEKKDNGVSVSDMLDNQNEQFVGFVVREGFDKLKFTTSDRVTLFDLYDVRLSVDCRDNSPSVSPAPTLSPVPTGKPTTERIAFVYTDYSKWKMAMDARGFTIVDNDLSSLLDGSKEDYLKLDTGSTNVGYFDINLSGNRLDNWIWTDKDDNDSVRYEGRYSAQRDVDLSFNNFDGDSGRAYGFAGVWKQYFDYQKGDLSFEVVVDGDEKNEEEEDDIVVVNDDDSNDMPWGLVGTMNDNNGNRNLRKDDEDDMVNVGELLTEENEQFVGIVAPNGFEELRFVRINDVTYFDLHDIKLSVSREISDPTPTPSGAPSSAPSSPPSNEPSLLPSGVPSGLPTDSPSRSPSGTPTVTSDAPSAAPTISISPSSFPTISAVPSSIPSKVPSSAPTVSVAPSFVPSTAPSTSTIPSTSPSLSTVPSTVPSMVPSVMPSFLPSFAPSDPPSSVPSVVPSLSPSTSKAPSDHPSVNPSLSVAPSQVPSLAPSAFPSPSPSTSVIPSSDPSSAPSLLPSTDPTRSVSPSSSPSASMGVFELLEAIVIRLFNILLDLLSFDRSNYGYGRQRG